MKKPDAPKKSRMNEADYKKIKLLQGAGLTAKQIVEVTGRHAGVQNLVKNTSSWAEYQRHNKDYAKSRHQGGPRPSRSPVEDASILAEMRAIEKNILENFDQVNERLGFIQNNMLVDPAHFSGKKVEHEPPATKRRFIPHPHKVNQLAIDDTVCELCRFKTTDKEEMVRHKEKVHHLLQVGNTLVKR